MGNYVVPGTTYLEMVLEAGKEYFKARVLSFGMFSFLRRLLLVKMK
jgi:hypothetical protein